MDAVANDALSAIALKPERRAAPSTFIPLADIQPSAKKAVSKKPSTPKSAAKAPVSRKKAVMAAELEKAKNVRDAAKKAAKAGGEASAVA